MDYNYRYMQHCSKRIVDVLTHQFNACEITKEDIINNPEKNLMVKIQINRLMERYQIKRELRPSMEIFCFERITGKLIKFTSLELVQ